MKRMAVTAIAAVLALTGAAGAQDSLTEEEVRSFIEAMVEDGRQLAADADWSAMTGWIERYFAEGGGMAVRGSLVASDGPVVSYQIVADREDLMRFGSMMLSGPQGMGEAIRDFSIGSEIQTVTVLPTGEAAAIVRFDEAGVLEFPAPQGAEGDAPPPIGFYSVTECNLRMAKQGDETRITMAACDANTTM